MLICNCSTDVCSSDLSGSAKETRHACDKGGGPLEILRRPDGGRRVDALGRGRRDLRSGRAGWGRQDDDDAASDRDRSEEHTSELQSLMRISYAVFCLKKKNKKQKMY